MAEGMRDRSGIGASRRAFVRDAVAGAAGAALVAAAGPFASAAGSKLGEISVDGVMLTYYGAPFGDDVTLRYTPGRAYDTTVALASAAAPDFALRASVPAGKESFFAGLRYLQSESTRVDGALTFQRRYASGETESISVVPPNAPEHTAVISVTRPRLEIVGRPDRPRFRFVPGPFDDSGVFTIANVAQLRTPSDYGLADSTVASWLARVPTDPAAFADPRFEPAGGASAASFTRRVRAEDLPKGRVSTTLSATIVESTFDSGELAGVLGVGETLGLEYFSAQEDRSGTVLTLDYTVDGPDAPEQTLYFDRIFKTFAFALAG